MTILTFEIEPDLLDVFPHPRPASKFVPEWYKETENTFPSQEQVNPQGDHVIIDGPTIKKCLPVRDYLTSGYIIPAWMDHHIKRDSAGKMQNLLHGKWQDHYNLGCEWHSKKQFDKSPMCEFSDGDKILKIVNPWRIKTPKGYSCLFYSPFYQKSDFTILPAIVDTDLHNVPINFPTIVTSDDAFIAQGEPLIQVFPFKRESWSHVVKKGDMDEFRVGHLKNSSMWESFYTKFLWHRKRFR